MSTNRFQVWLLGLVLAALALPVTPAWGQAMKEGVEKRCKRATVLVFTAISEQSKGDRKVGSGSGYFINSTGLLMTNNHVVDLAHRESSERKQQIYYSVGTVTYTIVTDAGTDEEKTWDAILRYSNDEADQAILQAVDEDGNMLSSPNFLRFLPESRLKEDMRVFAMGFPGGDRQRQQGQEHPEATITDGRVLGLPRTPGGRVRMIYTDVIARPGNSGGPMVDIDGFLVGTVTLMTKPEDREAKGTANYSALVPAKLTREMIRNAYTLGKMPEGTDFTPFIELLTNDDNHIIIPAYKRLREWETLYYEDGDRIYGNIMTESITWESPLGAVEVPLDAVAYVMSTLEGSNLFLEGGNRLAASEVGSSFKFKPDGAEETTVDFDDVLVTAFRTADREMQPLPPKALILDTPDAYLMLTDIEGQLKYESKTGVIVIELEDIERLELRADGENLLKLRDGRRLTGAFTSDPLKARIAVVDVPVTLRFDELDQMTIDIARHGLGSVAGLGLQDLFADAEHDVKRILDKVISGDLGDARPALNELMEGSDFRKLPTTKKDQIYLLDAVTSLREGRYEEAGSAFRKAARARNDNIVAYADACAEVLKHYESHEYKGQPLSDTATFSRAGMKLAEKLIKEVRVYLREERIAQTDGELKGQYVVQGERVSVYSTTRRGTYQKAMNDIRKLSENMRVASVLGGTDADDELIRLWQFACEVCLRESIRTQLELQEAQEEAQGRPGGGAMQTRLNRLKEKLDGYRNEAMEKYGELQYQLYRYGFRIEDPDIQKQRDAEGRGGEQEGP